MNLSDIKIRAYLNGASRAGQSTFLRLYGDGTGAIVQAHSNKVLFQFDSLDQLRVEVTRTFKKGASDGNGNEDQENAGGEAD